MTTKGILEGDTSRFAFGVAFQKDPDDGAGATREEALSWGGMQLWVEGQNLCEHREGGTIARSCRPQARYSVQGRRRVVLARSIARGVDRGLGVELYRCEHRQEEGVFER